MKTSPRPGRARVNAFRPSRQVWAVVLGALLAFAFALSAQAQSAGDPPSRVARLSEVDGQVWLYSPDNNEWVTVARNRPLTSGDRVATDNGAHAEITLGTTTLRLDAATELEIARLDDTRFQVRLQSGSVAARLRNPQSLAEFQLATDEGRFRAQTVGRYRFDRFDQASDVTVTSGQAIYEAGNTALPVTTGQHAQFWVDAASVPQYAMHAIERDPFFAWNEERDRAEDRVATPTRFVSPEMTGAEDLDRYGNWERTPEYGALWIPRAVPAGWAPYSTGHWVWMRPWGWTWVDDSAWGFAPFHYGRWVYHRNTWGWAPGTYVQRPVYAPALVAWVGGPRVSVSVSIGGGGPSVGWFPLAPREVYVPAYRTSPRYVREVNITHVTNVTNITRIVNNRNGEADRRDFVNRRFPHAVTMVPADVMLHRQPVAPVAARLRNDPQWRTLVSEAAPALALRAPPVTAPPTSPRAAHDRTPPRPPFEGRAPGAGFAGRSEGQRPGNRADTAARAEPERPGVVGSPATRTEIVAPGARPDGTRPEFGRGPAGRADGGRGGERVAPAPAAPHPAAPQPVAPPVVGASPAPAATPAGPPVGARGVVEPSIARPAIRGGAPGRETVPAEARPQVVVPPSPVQRNAQTGEPPGRRGSRNREAAADDRGGPKQPVVPGARNNAPHDVAPALREVVPPRPTVAPRPAEATVVAPAPAPVPRPHPAQRPPPPAAVAAPAVQPAAPVAPPVAAPAAPPAAQHGSEQRMTRPEAPRTREERREDRREERGEKQR